MDRSNLITLFFFSLVYLFSMSYLVKECNDKNEQLIQQNKEYVSILDFTDRLLNFEEWVSQSEWQSKKQKAKEKDAEIQSLKDYIVQYSYILIGVSILYALILYFSFSPKKRMFVLAFTSIFICIVFLLHGIFNPILEIGAFKENLTVKAKVTPINTEEYHESKKYVNNYSDELDSEIDSNVSRTYQKLNNLQSKLEYAKNQFNTLKNVISNIPLIPSEITSKTESIESYLDEAISDKQLLPNDLSSSLKEFKKVMVDSLNRRADLYAQDTYGINKVFPEKTYFYYEIKSIYSVIKSLWESNNYIVAICVGLFSIVIPFIKILLTLSALVFHRIKNTFLVNFIGSISKWSMADVFVLSAFLAYLSFSKMQTGVEIVANLQYGFYFFLMYVLLSMGSSVLLKRYLKSIEVVDNNKEMLTD